jgi:diaminopimelate epimerase
MNFTKMHGLGNDFVVVDGFVEQVDPSAYGDLARRVCDRHFGVGADGLVFVLPSDLAGSQGPADFRMRIFNSDGSEANHCGNAIRCVAKLLYETGRTRKTVITCETVGRVNVLQLFPTGGRVDQVRVDMGEPRFLREEVPIAGPAGTEAIDEPLEVDGETLRVTALSMGNPHAVTFVPDLDAFPFDRLGPKMEVHPAFPQRVNAEFIQVLGPEELRMRVWERGAGETLACGTGACASLVAAARTGRAARRAVVHLRGGDLLIEWGDDNHVYMTGPAVEVFRGVWPSRYPS